MADYSIWVLEYSYVTKYHKSGVLYGAQSVGAQAAGLVLGTGLGQCGWPQQAADVVCSKRCGPGGTQPILLVSG